MWQLEDVWKFRFCRRASLGADWKILGKIATRVERLVVRSTKLCETVIPMTIKAVRRPFKESRFVADRVNNQRNLLLAGVKTLVDECIVGGKEYPVARVGMIPT